MPPDSYDPTDRWWHPVLVVAVDDARAVALVATRTSQKRARGPQGLAHRADDSLGLDRVGWWRLHRLHEVPYSLFSEDEECTLRGTLDDQTWKSVVRRLGEGP